MQGSAPYPMSTYVLRWPCLAIIAAMLCALSGAPAAQSGTYWCPMHPDVRGAAGDRCAVCAMALVPMPDDVGRAFWLDVAEGSRAPVAGRDARLRFVVRDPRDGAPVRSFARLHDRLLHLFIVSHDLEYFAHVHPALEADGTFEQTIDLPRAGAYRLIADFAPDGAAPQLLQKTIVTAGFTGSVRPSADQAVDLADKIVDGVRVHVTTPEPVAGREQLVTFELEDAATGVPVEDLEPYLGASGHLLIVSSDLQTATHSHPVAEISSAAGPRVVFQLRFPGAGTYRLWLQFQRRGRVVDVPFTVRAARLSSLSPVSH
jgi:heavy metal-binding protein